MKRLLLILILLPIWGMTQTTDLLFSEYGEGAGGNKKYVEIFNGTGAAVNLANYQLWKNSNGSAWNATTLALTGSLANGATYVIANNNTDVIGANLYNTFIVFNGDDATGLAKFNGTTYDLIDVIGEENIDPGTGWDVAGTANGTVDKILIRKPTVCSPNTNWTTSRGTTIANSEWTISVDPYNATTQTTNLGMHTATCTAGCNLSTSGISALTCNDATTTSDPADDYLTFSLNPTGTTLGTTYTVSVPTGTITPTTGTYGTATSFQLQAGSAGGGNVDVTITDDTDGGCTIDQTITDPGACSSATPVITLTPASLLAFNHIVGTPSAEQTFTASGLGLTANISIAAPTNFEISLTTGVGFTNSITLTQVGGIVSSTTIYARANAATMGTLVGDIVGTSAGAVNDSVHVFGLANDYLAYTVDEINGTNATGVADSINVLVKINGTVQCMDYDTNAGYSLALIDANGDGIILFNGTDVSGYTSPVEGDSLEVKGKVVQFNGLLELQPAAITQLGTGTPATPMVVTALSEATEAMSIELMNLTLVVPIATFTANSNIDATDGTTTITIRIPSGSPLDGMAAPQGAFNVTGIGWQFDSSSPYDGGYQLYPCAFTDVCVTPSNATTTTSATTAMATATGVDYQWINCADNSVIATATSQSYTATITGSYAVIVTDGACSDTSACVTLTVSGVGINEYTLLNDVSVYPNPVNDLLTIKNSSEKMISYSIVDMNGKVITETSSVVSVTTVSTSNWNKGVYFVRFSSENGDAILRVIK